MKAIVYTGPKELQLMDVPEPEAGPGEVTVEVSAVGICGSELEGFASVSPFRVPPLIMGHEFAGLRLDTGEPVVVNPLVACGSCDLCLRGDRNLCRHRAIVGIHRPGAFAERVVVPEESCYRLSPGFDARRGALVEPLANAAHAFRLAQQLDPAPRRVGIIGAGMLGLGMVTVAVRRGVHEVAIADLVESRLAVAKEAGAAETGATLEGEFDVVFDAVGTARTRADSLERIRPGGVAVWIGLHGPEPGFDGLDLIRGEKKVLGTFCYHDQDFKAAIDLAADFALAWTTEAPLVDGVEAFTGLLGEPPPTVKTLLVP